VEMIRETPAKDSLKHYIITFSVMLATVMQALDSTIANVALPHIQGSLSATQDQMTWVLTSYIVASAIMIPLTGWLAGYIGRKLVFLVSIAGFIISSVLCGIAESLPEMIFFRLLQGISGAALVPLSQAVLFSINTKENYAKAMALWGVGVTMGPILGPVLGGWLTDNYNWRWVFYINVPIGLLALTGLYFFLEETEPRKSPFDFLGFFTLSVSVGALQIMLDRGELLDWFGSIEIIIEAIIAATGFYLFVVHTFTFQHPFVTPQLFKDRNFTISTVLIFVVGITLFATLALLPMMLQNQLNYPVSTAGIVTAPRGAGTMLAMLIVGRILNRIDPRYIIIAGLLIVAFSLWQMTQFSLITESGPIISAGFIQGFGIGLAYIAISTIAFSTVSSTLHNEGTSFFNLMRNLGSSIGISVVETMLIRNTQVVHASLTEHIIPYNVTANPAYIVNHIHLSDPRSIVLLNAMINNQAMMVAYIDDYYLIMLITLSVVPLVFLLRKAKKIDTTVSME